MTPADAMSRALKEGELNLEFSHTSTLELFRRRCFRHRSADRRRAATEANPFGESIFDSLSFLTRGRVLRIVYNTPPRVLPPVHLPPQTQE